MGMHACTPSMDTIIPTWGGEGGGEKGCGSVCACTHPRGTAAGSRTSRWCSHVVIIC